MASIKKLGNNLPQSLPKECEKAAKIFKSFVDTSNNGLDGVLPRSILENAKGFAIFTIFKAGFVFSARAGSGVVIAKLDDGTWSAPSAIGTAGLGVGGQLGAEMTDFLIVLNNRSAIRSFMASGSLTLGGNMSLAIGPLGRTGEASGALNTNGKVAAMYSYSKTRGLFGGFSIEGSVIVERQDANAQAYESPVTAKMLLGGAVTPPLWAAPLIKTLEACTGMPGNREWVNDGRSSLRTPDEPYMFSGVSNDAPSSSSPNFFRKKKTNTTPFPPPSWGHATESGSYFTETPPAKPHHLRSKTWDNYKFDEPGQGLRDNPLQNDRLGSLSSSGDEGRMPLSRSTSLRTAAGNAQRYSTSESIDHKLGSSAASAKLYPRTTDKPLIQPRAELSTPLLPSEGVARAIALYDFNATQESMFIFARGAP
ncbi:hypothetical protein CVT24_004282 [Panaeolus cyanescens]|uniref:Ysc84 actin-binding domain-containing protein n=1 Tax=Panaeolus cyanescens TaxID=181874 RepID=A0A409VA50_9AGAR|nr:hypothetical protein CVT24_004282 [Panaeolus cyanescens]